MKKRKKETEVTPLQLDPEMRSRIDALRGNTQKNVLNMHAQIDSLSAAYSDLTGVAAALVNLEKGHEQLKKVYEEIQKEIHLACNIPYDEMDMTNSNYVNALRSLGIQPEHLNAIFQLNSEIMGPVTELHRKLITF